MANASKKHFGAGTQGKGDGSGANTELGNWSARTTYSPTATSLSMARSEVWTASTSRMSSDRIMLPTGIVRRPRPASTTPQCQRTKMGRRPGWPTRSIPAILSSRRMPRLTSRPMASATANRWMKTTSGPDTRKASILPVRHRSRHPMQHRPWPDIRKIARWTIWPSA